MDNPIAITDSIARFLFIQFVIFFFRVGGMKVFSLEQSYERKSL